MSQKRAPPSRPVPSFPPLDPSRRSRSRSSVLSKLDLDSAFFWLLLVFLLTVFAFLSLRSPHIQLNPSQVAEYERRTQFLSNSTVYIVEVLRPETLLHGLPPAAWARISSEIDLVAYVFDDLQLFLMDDWVTSAEAALPRTSPRVAAGLGVALFPCGCVIPNSYFTRVAPRLHGHECTLLPGWVLPHEDVHWLDVRDGVSTGGCRRRNEVLASKMAARYRRELKEIHTELDVARREVDSSNIAALPQPVDSAGRADSSGLHVKGLVDGAVGAVLGKQQVVAAPAQR